MSSECRYFTQRVVKSESRVCLELSNNWTDIIRAARKQQAFMKGAVERIIESCTQIETENGPVAIDKEMEEEIHANVEALAEQGLRVLALAHRPWTGSGSGEAVREEVEKDMILQGLV